MTKPPELPPYVERVFDVVDRIPPGRVMAYGEVAEWLGEGGPRQVGTAMAKYGGGSPWWRVVRSDGGFLPGHEREALANYREEGTPLKPGRRPGRHGPRPLVACAGRRPRRAAARWTRCRATSSGNRGLPL